MAPRFSDPIDKEYWSIEVYCESKGKRRALASQFAKMGGLIHHNVGDAMRTGHAISQLNGVIKAVLTKVTEKQILVYRKGKRAG